MEKIDPRIKRTKKLLKDSLKELMLKSDDYTDITIKELCDKAEINRRTFYLHYDDIDEIVLEIQDDFTKEFYERTKEYDHIKDVEPVLSVFFDIHDENPIYEKIITSPHQDYLREIMRSRTVNRLDETDKLKAIRKLDIVSQNIVEQFYHMAAVSAYREWLRQRKMMPKKDVVNLLLSLSHPDLTHYYSFSYAEVIFTFDFVFFDF